MQLSGNFLLILPFLSASLSLSLFCHQVLHEFGVRYILNVTTKCPNYYEDEEFVYKRIAVTDTGTQKLSQHFREAFEFIGMELLGERGEGRGRGKDRKANAHHVELQSLVMFLK